LSHLLNKKRPGSGNVQTFYDRIRWTYGSGTGAKIVKDHIFDFLPIMEHRTEFEENLFETSAIHIPTDASEGLKCA
jgi:hypothetical protein